MGPADRSRGTSPPPNPCTDPLPSFSCSQGAAFGVGSFQNAGGLPVNGVACWDGAVWSAVGSGLSGYALCVKILANGDVVVGGLFTVPGCRRSLAERSATK